MSNLLAIIALKKLEFSKGNKKIAEFILNNYDKAVYLTVSELARATDVSESTVVRFATMLGFEGYQELSLELEKIAKENLEASKRLELYENRLSKSNKHLLNAVMELDAEKIKSSLNKIDENIFNEIVNNIIASRKVYIIGTRSSSSIAEFLAFHLNFMLENVVNISNSTGNEIYEQIFKITESDCCICFTFPRYSQRTIEAMKYASLQNANTIAITDNLEAPVCKFSKYNLIVDCNMISVVDSLVPAMSLVNAILVAISVIKKADTKKVYDKLEALWKENKAYSKTLD